MSALDPKREGLVLPAYDEGTILPLEQARTGHCILVVNEPPYTNLPANRSLLSAYATARHITLVDCTGKQGVAGGVGEARAIGFGRALRMIEEGQIRGPWIRTTDADVELPTDYWNPIEVASGTAACIYPFVHRPTDAQVAPHVQAYEASLRYYVMGLAFAGSPYAFHTIGSTLAVHADYYKKVHGFPKRPAGEDFYILNKLAKLGAIETLRRAPLKLDGRVSHRVPFGTGPAIVASMARRGEPWERLSYHPMSFRLLASALRTFESIAVGEVVEPIEIDNSLRTGFSVETHDAPTIAAALGRLHEDGTIDCIARASRERRTARDRLRATHTHFDAFRTLKWIHALRDAVLGPMPLDHALQHAPFLPTPPATCERRSLEWLIAAEAALPLRRGVPLLRAKQPTR